MGNCNHTIIGGTKTLTVAWGWHAGASIRGYDFGRQAQANGRVSCDLKGHGHCLSAIGLADGDRRVGCCDIQGGLCGDRDGSSA
jgi:hypothetical protein